MNDSLGAIQGTARPVLAIVIWVFLLAPQWILVVWGVRSLDRIRKAMARSVAVKLFAFACWIAAVCLAMMGTPLLCRDLLGPQWLGVQWIVTIATLIQEGLLIVVALLLLRRRRAANGSMPAQVSRKKPSPRMVAIALLAWSAAAVLALVLALGPLAGHPAAEHAWRLLALALVVVAVLAVILGKAIREKRNAADRPSPGS